MSLGGVVRRGAWQAIEAKLAQLLERYENVKTLHGQLAVVRNAHLPQREVLTALAVCVGGGNSIQPSYRPAGLSRAAERHLNDISTGDMSEAQ